MIAKLSGDNRTQGGVSQVVVCAHKQYRAGEQTRQTADPPANERKPDRYEGEHSTENGSVFNARNLVDNLSKEDHAVAYFGIQGLVEHPHLV